MNKIASFEGSQPKFVVGQVIQWRESYEKLDDCDLATSFEFEGQITGILIGGDPINSHGDILSIESKLLQTITYQICQTSCFVVDWSEEGLKDGTCSLTYRTEEEILSCLKASI